MKALVLILSILIFGQSLSVCGPEIAHHKHDLLVAQEDFRYDQEPSNDVCQVVGSIEKSSNEHNCCADKNSKNHHTSDSSEDESDCCGDACHCFCCAKILLNNAPEGSVAPDIFVKVSAEPSGMVPVHSFDFHPSISNPPQYAYLS